jgi:hypothetical protein
LASWVYDALERLWFDPGGQHSEIWLASAFLVEAEGRALGGCGWSLVLAWADRDGRSIVP